MNHGALPPRSPYVAAHSANRPLGTLGTLEGILSLHTF